ncbi:MULTISPECIES: hypothetical protein [unclassified Iodidimonas]|jgi:hypothetical protein|uniref:hypothetical protein n=1 Tax=unclassified Iodidimonas TaxID=2626145 RepID=UPI0024823A51|nr:MULTISPECIES: hypothetical protein [unclassified Iodidimonas]
MTRRLWPQLVPLGLMALLLIILAALALRTPPDFTQNMPVDEDASAFLGADHKKAEPVPPVAPGQSTFAAIIERNLFAIDRKPPLVRTVASTGPALASTELALVGVIMGDAGGSAIVEDKKSKDMSIIGQGESYRGWELLAVSQWGASFIRNGERLSLSLQFAPGAEGVGSDPYQLGMPAHLVKPRSVITPRRGDANGNPVPASRQNKDPDRLDRRGSGG